MSRPRGFTLIELLVVLVIIGVVVGAALYTVRAGGEQRLARDEARRLQHVIDALRDESVHGLLELGLQFRRGGYRVLVWDGSDWLPYERASLMLERRWPEAIEPSLTVEGQVRSLPMHWPVESQRPDVVLLSSGEVGAFTLSLAVAGDTFVRLVVGADGGARLEVTGRP